MDRILIVKNITREGPGLLAAVLAEQNISYDVVDLSKGGTFPSPLAYRALIVLGGPASANDRTALMADELAGVRQALDHHIPYLGICLGLQAGVMAAGGSVVAGDTKETGLRDPEGNPYTVQLTAAGKNDPLLAGLADEVRVFQLHGETVVPTADMMVLGTGKWCTNQIVRIGERAYGIQSHFELTPEMLAVWAAEDPDLAPLGAAALLTEFHTIREEYTRTGRTLLHNFLQLASLYQPL